MPDFEMTPLDSSNIAAAGYDEESRTLRVEFRSGGTYDYPGVPKETYDGLIAAPSPGSYFHRAIKSFYPAERIS